ncbi:MAG: (Fe-S)-binding protein [Verrucomicrobia bacterium]|nr:(Fe-S)-binding protein [Verrucomicrobiota bacterium]
MSPSVSAPPKPVSRQVLFMATCLCDAFFPEAAQAAVQVLEHAGCEVLFPPDQTCCGQPAFNSGDFPASRRVARHTETVFAGELPVIVPSGSCAAMHLHGHALQFEGEPDSAKFGDLGRRTWELCDFLVNGLGLDSWPGSFPHRIALHDSCHTRGSGTRSALRTLLGSINGLTLLPFAQQDQCCGFGGTFCVSFPHVSGSMGTLKLDHVLEEHPDFMTSADLSCLMHLAGLAERQNRPVKVLHIAQILLGALPR